MSKVKEVEFGEVVNKISDAVNKNKECNYVIIYFDWKDKYTQDELETACINLSQLISLKCDKLVLIDIKLPNKEMENGSIALYTNPQLQLDFNTKEEE